MKKNCDLFPPYMVVLDAKKECYPHDDYLTFTESKAEVKLQGLLDHTVERILLLKRIDIAAMSESDLENVIFICK